ncbi:MAG: hypothetical protein AAFY88_07500 [Acidobacteriota bacterium]
MSIVVTKAGQVARRVEPGGVQQESDLQDFILDNPEALPLTDIREDLRFVVVAHEFPTASGPVDAVGLDDRGNLYLIETKLYKNPDKRRVLAQVLDYGAALWRHKDDPKPFKDRLEESARGTLKADLAERLCSALAIEPDEVDAILREAEKQAEEGSFRFVVLMDYIDDRLRDLIGFINENSRFDVYGIEIQFYRFDGYEVAIPKLHGAEARKEVARGSTSSRGRWSEERYFDDASSRLDPTEVEGLRQLYDYAIRHADRVTWGTGVTMGSFSLKYEHIHPTKSVVSVYSNGRIDLNFHWLSEGSAPPPAAVQNLAESLRRLAGWDLPPDHADTFVGIPSSVWARQVDIVLEALGALSP